MVHAAQRVHQREEWQQHDDRRDYHQEDEDLEQERRSLEQPHEGIGGRDADERHQEDCPPVTIAELSTQRPMFSSKAPVKLSQWMPWGQPSGERK